MNHRLLSLLAAFILYSTFGWSQESSFTAELGFGAKVVDRGMQLADNAFTPSIEYSVDDFYIGVWSVQLLENKGWPEYFLDEYDIYAGYGWALNAKTTMDVGATHYYYPNGKNSFEGYLGFTREMGTFSPSLYIYNDFELDALTIEVSTDIALPLEIFPFETRIFAGIVDAGGAGDYDYFGADVVYPIEINDSTNLSLGLHYSDNDLGFGVAGDHLYGSASVAVRF